MQRTLALSGLLASILIAAAIFLAPLTARAQIAPPTALRTAIRAELLSDPRTSSLSPAQLTAMVNLLANQAEKEHLTVAQIEHQIAQPAPSAPAIASPCPNAISCMFDQAFQFVGPDTTIPLVLGISAIGLVWILAEMLHRKKFPHPPATPTSM